MFDNEIDTVTGTFENGEVVLVHDFDGYPMGRGFINVNSKNGNAILLSEEDYNGLLETVYLLSSRQTASELLDALQEPLAQGTPFDPKEEW